VRRDAARRPAFHADLSAMLRLMCWSMQVMACTGGLPMATNLEPLRLSWDGISMLPVLLVAPWPIALARPATAVELQP
jgi:hypothetical protein